jgi:hypothetical protein
LSQRWKHSKDSFLDSFAQLGNLTATAAAPPDNWTSAQHGTSEGFLVHSKQFMATQVRGNTVFWLTDATWDILHSQQHH